MYGSNSKRVQIKNKKTKKICYPEEKTFEKKKEKKILHFKKK